MPADPSLHPDPSIEPPTAGSPPRAAALAEQRPPFPPLARAISPAAPGARSSLSKWLTGIVLLLIFSGFAIYSQRQLDAEIRAMPTSERRTLYARTLEILRTTCTRDADAHAADLTVLATSAISTLGEHCGEQAELIRRFPECDRACRRLAERFVAQPAR